MSTWKPIIAASLALAAMAAMAAMAAGAAPASSPASRFQPPASNLRPRVLPFTNNVVTGPFRGTQHCYICDPHDDPAVLIFARDMDAPTAALLRRVRDAVRDHADRRLFGWFVFLGQEGPEAESRLEERAYGFARTNDATSIPVSALGEPDGPPGYVVAPSARVTVLLFRQGKVLSRRSFTAKEWSVGAAARTALADLPRLLAASPPARHSAAVTLPQSPPSGSVDAR